jgi:hypothetical protein
MYQILNDPRRLTFEEIAEEFRGKWVYLVDLDGSKYSWFNTAVVAVVADNVLEGRETGIYDEFYNKYDGRVADIYFSDKDTITGFREVLINED